MREPRVPRDRGIPRLRGTESREAAGSGQRAAGRDTPVAGPPSPVNLAVEIAGIRMKNPVMTASGTFGYAREFEDYMDLNRLGALVVKTITRRPRAGNPPPRIVETPAGMLNAIGLQNVGIDGFIHEKLPYLRQLDPPLIVNVAGESVEDFRDLVKRISDCEGVAGVELNVSCPNVAGGLDFSTDPVLAHRVVKAAREATRLPLIPKLSPNVADVAAIARAVVEAGADAVSLINTLVGLAIDVRTRRPKIGNVTGGLSGPAIRPVAVRMVWQVARAVRVPVIGMGGIVSAEDALEFLIAGATAVAVGTANFVDPAAAIKIIDGMEQFCIEHRVRDVRELIGSLEIPPTRGA